MEQEPYLLTREQIDTIHRDQIDAYGGLHGLRSEHALESAIAQPQNVYFYGDGDLSEPELATYEAIIRVAMHKLDRPGLGAFLRDVLKPKA